MDAVPFYKIISGMLERAADERFVSLLTCEVLWSDALPAEEKTIEHQVLAFDLINAGGALMLENLGSRRTRAPQSVFAVDLNPGNEEFLVDLPRCMCTPWAWKHITPYLGASATYCEAGWAREENPHRFEHHPFH